MDRLTPEREKVIKDWVERCERGSFVSWRGFVCELLSEIDALRAEIKRLHEKYDLQLLVVQRDRYREALERVEKNTRMGPLLTGGTIQAVRDALGMVDPRQQSHAQAAKEPWPEDATEYQKKLRSQWDKDRK